MFVPYQQIKAFLVWDEVYVEADGDLVKQISKNKKVLGSIAGEFIGVSRLSYDFYLKLIPIAEES